MHIWRACLRDPVVPVERLYTGLATDERARAERFRFEVDRNDYVIARAALRWILARYCKMRPEELVFQYSPFGKPSLCLPAADQGIEFNVTHTHGLALYAVARNRRVGIDVEWVRPDLATNGIAEQFFSSYEVAVLQSLDEPLRTEAFFHCWTRKEAYIKARGEGLSFPLCQFDVSLTPGEPAALLRTRTAYPGARDDPPEAARWSMQTLSPGPGYVAAVAIERGKHEIAHQLWQFCNKTAFLSF